MRKAILILLAVMSIGLLAAQVSRERIAVRELARKAAAGDAKALYELATLHDRGYDSIPVDTTRSTTLYRLSAERGYAPAQNYLGFRYFNGEGVREDVDSALFWLAKAAGGGDVKAANNLGYLLANGDKVTRDYKSALYWLRRAAEAGLPAGESQLADLYRQGLGTEPDTLQAISLYTSAIEHGLSDAELKLLSMMGRKWEQLPVDSMLTLGRYYYTHRAPFIGVTLFENAAAQESAAAYALLGDAYSRGAGVGYDHDKSIEYFLRGALGGDPSAQFVIAELLDMFPDALEGELSALFTDSSSEVFPDSSSGAVHDSSSGIRPDELKSALYWYEKAAACGVTDADTATRRLLHPD